MSSLSDAQKAEALRLWNEEHLSASAIAERFGGIVSRNSVLGTLHRSGKAERRGKSPMARIRRVERMKDWQPKPVATDKLEKERQRQLRVRGHGNRVRGTAPLSNPLPVRVKAIPRPPEPIIEPTSATNVPLVGLEYGMCRYPIGALMEPAKLFCGGPVKLGHSWCPAHCLIAYQPPQRRERPPGYTAKPTFEEA